MPLDSNPVTIRTIEVVAHENQWINCFFYLHLLFLNFILLKNEILKCPEFLKSDNVPIFPSMICNLFHLLTLRGLFFHIIIK